VLFVKFYYSDQSRRLKRARHIVHMGEMKNSYKIFIEELKGREHLRDLNVDGGSC
jgi:hypothetical protein